MKTYKQALSKNLVAVAAYVRITWVKYYLVRTHSKQDSWDLPGRSGGRERTFTRSNTT